MYLNIRCNIGIFFLDESLYCQIFHTDIQYLPSSETNKQHKMHYNTLCLPYFLLTFLIFKNEREKERETMNDSHNII